MSVQTFAVLDGTSLGVVTSPLHLTGLNSGGHTLQLYNYDTETLQASAFSVFTWTIDAAPAPGDGSGVYTKTVILPNANGPNQILVRATDLQSTPQTSVVVRNVTVTGAVGPSVAVAAPSNGQFLYSPTITVIANVDDETASIVSVQATLDGTTYQDMVQIGANQYSASMQLASAEPGDQFQVSVIATDSDGNQAVDTSVVTVQIEVVPGGGQGNNIIGQSTISADRVPVKFELRIFDHDGDLVGIPECMPQWGRYLDAAGYMNASIDLHDPMAIKDRLNPDVHDWGVYRNGVKIEGGIITDAAVDTDSRSLQITGATWLAYLQDRFMDFDTAKTLNAISAGPNSLNISQPNVVSLTYINVDLFDIVRSLLDYILGVTDSIPITYDTHDSGIIVPFVNFDASDGSDTLSRLTDLSTAAPGFDFEMSPDCHLSLYTPQKGTQIADFMLDLERNVFAVNGYENTGIKANRVFVQGEGTGSSSANAFLENTVLQPSRRKKDMSADAGTVYSRAQLNSFGRLILSLATQEQIGFQVRILAQGLDVWSICGPGDSIRVQANLEYDVLSGYYRILSMEGAPTDQGDEYVTFTFGPSPLVDA